MKEEEIDPRFFNSETGTPFERCLVCSKELVDSGEDYFVERIFRRVEALQLLEPIFEYAVCSGCANDMRKDLSKESLRNIEQYFNEKLALQRFNRSHDPLEKCLLTGKSIGQSTEFSYHAHCHGNKMLHSVFPYAISDEAMDEMSELLSDETTDQLDDFKNKHFTGPPEIASLINPKRLILI